MTASPVVLIVCTGNICRSPAAELLLAAAIPDVRFTSAGSGTVDGRRVEPQMAVLLRADGLDPDPFVSTRLGAEAVTSADLILAMSREHLAAISRLSPVAARKAYLIEEFAWLAPRVPTPVGGTSPERFTSLIALVGRARSRLIVESAAVFVDILDPYRRGDDAFAAAYGRIRTLSSAIANVVS